MAMKRGILKWCPAAVLKAVLAAAVTLAPGAAGAQSASNQTILEHFNIIAFGNEYTGRRYDHVRKWRAPIAARIDGDPPAYFEDFVRQHLADLAKITGHPMSLAYSARMLREKRVAKGLTPKSFNMFLLFYPMDEMAAVVRKQLGSKMDHELKLLAAGKTTCMARFFTRDNEIRTVVVLFPATHGKEYLRACVVEELTQVMGLPNDSDAVKPSIFNDQSPYFELTDHDRRMLKMLYDPRITPGMPRQEALRQGRLILDELTRR